MKEKAPDHEDSFWQEWIGANTHKQQVIDEARAIVSAIHPIDTENICALISVICGKQKWY